MYIENKIENKKPHMNKGKLIGQKRPLKQREIWVILFKYAGIWRILRFTKNTIYSPRYLSP